MAVGGRGRLARDGTVLARPRALTASTVPSFEGLTQTTISQLSGTRSGSCRRASVDSTTSRRFIVAMTNATEGVLLIV